MLFINQIPLPIQLYVPLMLMVLAAAALGFLLSLGWHHRRRIGDAIQRWLLRRQLQRLRMNWMLGVRGIDRERYIRMTPVAELRCQMANCRGCVNKARCNTSFIVGVESDPYRSYCPNTPSLDLRWDVRRAAVAQRLSARWPRR